MPRDRSDEPIYPRLDPDQEPALDEVSAHNLAYIGGELNRLNDVLERGVELLERISGHLFDMKRRS